MELDPLKDLARSLAELSDLPRFKPRVPAGGSASQFETIALDACWCGRHNGHDWIGREDGSPHPRYPE